MQILHCASGVRGDVARFAIIHYFGTAMIGQANCKGTKAKQFLSPQCTSVCLFLQWKLTVFCPLSVQAWLVIA